VLDHQDRARLCLHVPPFAAQNSLRKRFALHSPLRDLTLKEKTFASLLLLDRGTKAAAAGEIDACLYVFKIMRDNVCCPEAKGVGISAVAHQESPSPRVVTLLFLLLMWRRPSPLARSVSEKRKRKERISTHPMALSQRC